MRVLNKEKCYICKESKECTCKYDLRIIELFYTSKKGYFDEFYTRFLAISFLDNRQKLTKVIVNNLEKHGILKDIDEELSEIIDIKDKSEKCRRVNYYLMKLFRQSKAKEHFRCTDKELDLILENLSSSL